MFRKIVIVLLLSLLYGCNNKKIIVIENNPTDIGAFYVLLCPQYHQVYFTDKTIERGDIIRAANFHTYNRGYFYKGTYQPMKWTLPLDNQLAICSICKKMLIFEEEYLIRLTN